MRLCARGRQGTRASVGSPVQATLETPYGGRRVHVDNSLSVCYDQTMPRFGRGNGKCMPRRGKERRRGLTKMLPWSSRMRRSTSGCNKIRRSAAWCRPSTFWVMRGPTTPACCNAASAWCVEFGKVRRTGRNPMYERSLANTMVCTALAVYAGEIHTSIVGCRITCKTAGSWNR